MKILKPITLLTFLITVASNVALNAQEIMIASGAGYKKPVQEIANNFENTKHIHITGVFGNIQMITNQAKQTEEIACIIGDRKLLKKMENTVSYAEYTKLGNGILVLAYRKGIKINDIKEITSSSISSVFMPHEKKAIYGNAGKEALVSLNILEKVTPKLTQVATVPQVVSYLLTEEADAGFINLTEALANSGKLGGYIIVEQDNYKPIEIVAGVVNGFEEKSTTKDFIAYLKSEEAKKILSKYGL